MDKILKFFNFLSDFKNLFTGFLFVLLLISLTNIYKIWNENKQLHKELIGTQEKYQQISDNLAKLQVDYVDKDKLLLEYKQKFSELSLKEKALKSISEVHFSHKTLTRKLVGHELVYVSKTKTFPGYYFDEVRLAGPDSPPIGWVMVSDDGVVRTGSYKFNIVVNNLRAQDPKTGRVQEYSKSYLVLQQNGLAGRSESNLKKWKGEKYPLNIVEGHVSIDPTESDPSSKRHLYFISPRASLSVDSVSDGSSLNLSPSVGVSLSGYGYSKRDLDYRFLSFGIGDINNNLYFSFKPVLFRPLKNTLPNTYVGPGVIFDVNKKLAGVLSIDLSF